MILDVTPLEKAIGALKRGIIRSTASPGDEELRDAVIQRFEFTMDLAWKFMQRFLKNAGVTDNEIRTKRDLFRETARIGLIGAPEKWFAYYEARNETSHTYNQEVAERVYQKALEFFEDVTGFLIELKQASQDD